MGGSQTFNKALNDLKVKIKKPPDINYVSWLGSNTNPKTTIYVDVSVIFYILHATSDLGFESFFCNTNVDDSLVQRYLDKMNRYLEPLKIYSKVVMVFEAGGSRQNRKRSKNLNNGIRNVFLKKYHGSTFLGKNTIYFM